MNSNNSVFLAIPDFHSRREAADELLVRITERSFSYAVVNPDGETLKALFDLPDCDNGPTEALRALEQEEIFSLPFERVLVAVQTDNQLFVPPSLSTDGPSAYAKYFKHTDGTAIHVRHEADFETVYTLPASAEAFCAHFDQVGLLPLAAPVLKMSSHLEGDALLIDFNPQQVSMLYRRGGTPVFFQTYEVADVEELNYYLLLLMDTLDIDPATPVYLTGILHENDSWHGCVTKYFSNVYFFLPAQHGLDLGLLDDLPAHYYTTLLAQRLCEL